MSLLLQAEQKDDIHGGMKKVHYPQQKELKMLVEEVQHRQRGKRPMNKKEKK